MLGYPSFMLLAMGTVLGTVLGLLTGYYRGVVDDVLSRIIDAFLAIPATLMVALGLFSVLADADSIQTLVEKLGTVMPEQENFALIR